MINYEKRTYLVMTVDPVHIGTGGYRLGRVDNAIIREPGTNLPKIPGTSLSGAIRQYAAYHLGKPECAGQGQRAEREDERKSNHCGNCQVCYTFGFVKGEGKAFAGTVNLFDAKILMFPVYSIQGPVWVTTRELLEEYHCRVPALDMQDTEVMISWDQQDDFLNLGWLLLDVKKKNETIQLPENWENMQELKTICNKIVVVKEKFFTHIVNSNLEVRTSVSIDPFTGAAESGALFTYEAIPRATILSFDVVKDDYRDTFKDATPKFEAWNTPLDVVNDGLKLAGTLGIGGMGTRGFGRIRSIGYYDSPINNL